MGGLCAGESSEEKGTHTEDEDEQSILKGVRTLSPLAKTVMVIRHDCRDLFGPSFADKWGFFVDRNMSTEIHCYLNWVDYPNGDHVLEGHTGGVKCAVITSDGCYLFTGAWEKYAIKWDLRTNEMISQFYAHTSGVSSLAHTPGLLIVGSAEGKIQMLNDQDYSLIRTLKHHFLGVNSLCLNKRGTILVSGSLDHSCGLWSLKSGECLTAMIGHTNMVQRVLFAGDAVISGSYDKSLRIWDAHSGKELRKITFGIRDDIYDISLNSDSSTLVCCYYQGLTLFKYPSMAVLSMVDMSVDCCHFHPSIPTLFTVSDPVSHSIKVFRTDISQVTHSFEGHTFPVRLLRSSPDGTRLISVSIDKTVRVWQLSDLV